MKKQHNLPVINIVGGPSREDLRDAIGAKNDRPFKLIFKIEINSNILNSLHKIKVGFGEETGIIEVVVDLVTLQRTNSDTIFNINGLVIPKCLTSHGSLPMYSANYDTSGRKGIMLIGWPNLEADSTWIPFPKKD